MCVTLMYYITDCLREVGGSFYTVLFINLVIPMHAEFYLLSHHQISFLINNLFRFHPRCANMELYSLLKMTEQIVITSVVSTVLRSSHHYLKSLSLTPLNSTQ